jgi:hypothetical protein
MVYAKGVPVTYQTMFTVPTLALSNIMAGYVFRHAKLGMISRDGTKIWGNSMTGVQPSGGINSIPLANIHMQNSKSYADTVGGVVVSKTVEEFDWDTATKNSSAKAQLV